MTSLDPSQLVFLDESGFHVNMTRNYGWAPPGIKPLLYGSKRGKKFTLVGAISVDGDRGHRLIEGSMNGDDFLRYIREDLGPNLRTGDLVVMDRLSTHRMAPAAAALREFGAVPLFLPAYSPEYNPIEMWWSVLKSRVRAMGPRVMERLDAAVTKVIGQLDAGMCARWVRHCGYQVST
jgi:transposase